MQHITLIGANKTRNGAYNFYFRSKAGWKYDMTVTNIGGAEDMYQNAPRMTFEEYNALPNQLDEDFIKLIKQ